MSTNPQFWKRCSTCKKEIGFKSAYYRCSVSTCKHSRTGFYFCSVPCWDGHLGYARHREAWAEDHVSPSQEEHLSSQPGDSSARSPQRKIVDTPALGATPTSSTHVKGTIPKDQETLVVVSKVKQLIRERSDFSVSQCCIDALTRTVAEAALTGIEAARAAGRKTVMGRDIK